MDFFNKESLYYTFGQLIRVHYHRMHGLLDNIGLYPGQPPLLIALYLKDGQSQKELSKKLCIKPATLTVMISRMEKAEFLEKKQDLEDQRVSRVYLTEKGREACGKLKEIMNTIEGECFKDFTLEEQLLLRRLFMQMIDNLKEVTDNKLDH